MASWWWWLAGGATLVGGVGVIVYESRKSKTASTSSSTTPPAPGPTPAPASKGNWLKLLPLADGPQGTPVYEVAPGATFALAIPSSSSMAQDLIGTLQQEAQQGPGSPISITASSGPGQPNPAADWPNDDSYGANAYRLEGKVSTDVAPPAQGWPPGLLFGATTGDVSQYTMWQWVPASS